MSKYTRSEWESPSHQLVRKLSKKACLQSHKPCGEIWPAEPHLHCLSCQARYALALDMDRKLAMARALQQAASENMLTERQAAKRRATAEAAASHPKHRSKRKPPPRRRATKGKAK